MSAEHEQEHIVSVGLNVGVFFALVVLTITTFLVARIDLGEANIVVALLIAGVKGSLVALFFMHLKYSNKTMRLVFVGSLFWLVLLIGLSMNDYIGRQKSIRYPGGTSQSYSSPATPGTDR